MERVFVVGTSCIALLLLSVVLGVALQEGWTHVLVLCLPYLVAAVMSLRVYRRPTMTTKEIGLHLLNWVAAVLSITFITLAVWQMSWQCFMVAAEGHHDAATLRNVPMRALMQQMCEGSRESLATLWILLTILFAFSCVPLISFFITLARGDPKKE